MPPVGARWFVPEVVQTSAMDCGPASLKAVLEGFGIRVSYGRLREACQTSVDGTSIDTIEDLFLDLGFDAEQVMLPPDHLLLDEARALPALVLVRQPSGAAHFTVAWRRFGSLIQVMDPAVGRRWVRRSDFIRDLFVHTQPVPAADWLAWAGSEDFLAPLRRRMGDLGIPPSEVLRMINSAFQSGGWRPVAALDAATRFAATLVGSRAVRRGPENAALIEKVLKMDREAPGAGEKIVPRSFWSVQPSPNDDDGVVLRGAVLVRILGRKEDAENADFDHLPQEVKAALAEEPVRPGRELIRLMFREGLLAPSMVVAGLVIAAGSVVFEGLLFRGLIDGGRLLGLEGQRAVAILALMLLLVVRAGLKLPIAATALQLGRRLETGLRIAFFEKVPRLQDRYFRSRLRSDMAERAHMVHALHEIPALWTQIAEAGFLLVALTAGIIWLDPEGFWKVIAMALLSVVTPMAAQGLLAERDLRVRTHAGGLTRFSLDTLLGLSPIRCHGAERAIARNHEALVVDWSVARRSLLGAGVLAEALLALMGYGLMVWLVWGRLLQRGEPGTVLLFVYWGLRIPALGMHIAGLARQLPARRNIFLRLHELLVAPDEADTKANSGGRPATGADLGVAFRMSDVEVRAGGRTLLEDVELSVEPGTHIAVVGPSGAGKSTLAGLLLGWYRPSRGQFQVDGEHVDAGSLARLRQATAWIDPEVRLWNRDLLGNLCYGNPAPNGVGGVISGCGLLPVLEDRALGLKTPLGEGGTLVSGGEGQRIRLARAMLRKDVRMVILDEAFRGLHRSERQRLLAQARQRWEKATLVFVTHDITESLQFDRVLVLEEGRIVQDGRPEELAGSSEGSFSRMLQAQWRANQQLREGPAWRRLSLDESGLSEKGWRPDAV